MERIRCSLSVENLHKYVVPKKGYVERNSPLEPVRGSVSVGNLHKYILPKEDFVEKNERVEGQKRPNRDEDDRVLAKAATFLCIFFQLCYVYFVDIVKRAIYLTNLQHSSIVEESYDDETRTDAKRLLKDSEIFPVLEPPGKSLPIKSDISDASVVQKQCRPYQIPVETNYITAVFEVRNGGLKELIDDITDEIRGWQTNAREEEFIACCEIVWSVPTKYRNYPSEIRLKNEISNCLRVNNQRVMDSEVVGNDDLLNRSTAIGCITEETAGRNNDCYMGIYRRYYQQLLDLAHYETKSTHEPDWKFNSKKLEPTIEWPAIGSLENTSVVTLNVVCVKF